MEGRKIRLFMILNSFSLIALITLYYGGANSLFIGSFTIIMFIVTSIVFLKIFIKQSSRRGTRNLTNENND